MQRQVLTDGTGRWFDLKKAEVFDEDTIWDGNNYLSKATGSQWDHEELYRTAGGRWIKHWWSQWQGSVDSWVELSAQEAAEWLSVNGHDPHPSVEKEYAGLEIT